jgi:hypothetical protein
MKPLLAARPDGEVTDMANWQTTANVMLWNAP